MLSRPFFSSLRVRLMLLVLFAVIPALGLTIYTSLQQRRRATVEAHTDALRVARAAAAQQGATLEGARVLLAAVAQLSEVRGHDADRCSALFASLVTQYPRFVNLGVATPNGDILCSSLPPTRPINTADRAYFQRALKTRAFTVGDYQIGRITGKATINAGYPVLDATGEVQAVVFVAIDLAWINLVAVEAQLPDGTTLTVINSNGLIMARFPDPHKWVGRSVPEVPVVKTVLGRGGEGTVEAAGVDGIHRLYAFTPLAHPDETGHAYVTVGIPTAFAYAEVSRLLIGEFVRLGVVAFVGFLAAWLVGDRFVLRQVNALVTATNRVRAGDLSARTGVTSKGGELHQLAGAFDNMATALQQRAAEAQTAQEAARRQAERLEVLHKIDQAILTAQSPDAVADAALDQIRNLVPCRRASISIYDFNASEVRTLAARSLGENPVGAGMRISFEAIGYFNETLDVLRQGKVHVSDLQAFPRPTPLMQALQAAGLRYFTVVPLMAQGQLIGSLNLATDSPGLLAAEYLDIAREVADQMAVAIQHAQLREDLQQHAAVLEQRVAERTVELEKARQEADRANQAKSEFLSRMSHELRTPLNSILGFGQLLEMDSLNPEQQESVAHILKAGRHLLDLINEVLDIARIEAGRLHISLEPVMFDDVLKDTLDLIAPMASEADVQLCVTPEVTSDRHVLADQQRLKQVLLNLLSNAIKYNYRGGTATISQEEMTGRLRIKVTDTGRGIHPEELSRLFTPFERLGADQGYVEGTGLGLALSKRLVEAMGGHLGVESTVGQGSTFWMEFALVKAPERRFAEVGEHPPAPARFDVSQEPRVVLYIEDNLSNLKLIERLLVDRPEVKILSAMQGRLGLDLAREHHPDLILLDLHLPDIPGVEVLRHLRSDPETAEIPVVVISADATAGQIERLLGAGARAYLTKPLEVKKLFELLEEILEEQPSTSLPVT